MSVQHWDLFPDMPRPPDVFPDGAGDPSGLQDDCPIRNGKKRTHDEELFASSVGPSLMHVTQSAYRAIMEYHLSHEPEVGGMLLGPADDELITHFIPDEGATVTRASFTLDAAGLNRVLQQFRGCRMNGKGLVHLHPSGMVRPSYRDVQYVAKTFANPKNQAARQFFLPIVCDGRLHPYVLIRERQLRVLVAELVLI